MALCSHVGMSAAVVLSKSKELLTRWVTSLDQ